MRSPRVPLRRLALASLTLILALAGCTTPDDRKSPPEVPATAALGTPSPSPSTTPSAADEPKTAKPKIDKAALTYFFKIALGAEYGDNIRVVTRWMKPVVTVRVAGKPSAADRDCLGRVVSDFNKLTATTDLKLTTSATADIRVHFAPVSRFASLEPNYVPNNDGFFHVDWSAGYVITNANILIRTTGITSRIRCHLIREELTQSTGLMRDADDHPSSVFYGQYWSAPTRYSALDRKLIKLLYGGAVAPGDTKKAVTAAVTVT
ncbi:DUF2927 domain-containing protein [Nucisporomicrobium flavum]|uniref:DUF2927 domain-containing protein n=1 Tax=Nucisporomicrobium flavum TaxID=2785915 RepID=UPI003C2C4CB2